MIIIRKAKEEDLQSIRTLATQTWPSTYLGIISQEQINFMLEKMYNKGQLLQELREGYVFLVAAQQFKDIAFAAYSIIDTHTQIYKLHKLYVLPEFHGQHIGKLLINEVYQQIRYLGGKFIRLNVNKYNKAKDFYLKSGFKIVDQEVIDIGNGFVMDDYILEIEINQLD